MRLPIGLLALLLLATSADAQHRGRRGRGGGPTTTRQIPPPLLDPAVTANPSRPEYNQIWYGTRDYGPARPTDNLFIGYREPVEMQPLAGEKSERAEPEPGPPEAQPFDWSSRLPADIQASAPPAETAAKPAARTKPSLPQEPDVPADFGPKPSAESLGPLGPAPYHEIAMVAPPAEPLKPGRLGPPSSTPLPTFPSGRQEPLEPLGPPAGPAPYERDVDALLESTAERAAAEPKALKKLPSGEKESLPRLGAPPRAETSGVEAKPVFMEDADAAKLAYDAVPDLIALIESKGRDRLRARAADELGRRGKDAAAAQPALTAALSDPSDRVKASAALALGNVAGDLKPLKKPLQRLLKSDNPDVRQSAQTALDRLEN